MLCTSTRTCQATCIAQALYALATVMVSGNGEDKDDSLQRVLSLLEVRTGGFTFIFPSSFESDSLAALLLHCMAADAKGTPWVKPFDVLQYVCSACFPI
jgi:hypothetical protein